MEHDKASFASTPITPVITFAPARVMFQAVVFLGLTLSYYLHLGRVRNKFVVVYAIVE